MANRPIAFPNLPVLKRLVDCLYRFAVFSKYDPTCRCKVQSVTGFNLRDARWLFGFETETFFQNSQTSKDHEVSSQSVGVRLRIQFESNESSWASVATDGSEPLGSQAHFMKHEGPLVRLFIQNFRRGLASAVTGIFFNADECRSLTGLACL